MVRCRPVVSMEPHYAYSIQYMEHLSKGKAGGTGFLARLRDAAVRRDLAFRVTPREDGSRLDRFLRDRVPDVPARSVRFAIAAGRVSVNGARAAKGVPVREGDRVAVSEIAEREDWLPAPGAVTGAAVLYRDDWAAVLDKPAGVHTEAHRPGETGTLAGFLRWICPSVVEFSEGPGLSLLTRLDYATSGAVPAALTEEAFQELRRQRDHGEIRKTYLCVVSGRFEGELVMPYPLETEGGERARVRMDLRDPDESRWTTVTPVRAGEGWTLVRARIRRGKRHQIRAHLAAAGFPIVGDRLYSAVPPSGPGHERLLLHAEAVEFVHPGRGERVRVESPAPPAFAEFRIT